MSLKPPFIPALPILWGARLHAEQGFFIQVNRLLVLSILLKVSIYPLRFGVLPSQIISSLMMHIHEVYVIFELKAFSFYS